MTVYEKITERIELLEEAQRRSGSFWDVWASKAMELREKRAVMTLEEAQREYTAI